MCDVAGRLSPRQELAGDVHLRPQAPCIRRAAIPPTSGDLSTVDCLITTAPRNYLLYDIGHVVPTT